MTREELIEFVKSIPDEKLDMHRFPLDEGGCGCVQAHIAAKDETLIDDVLDSLGVQRGDLGSELFAVRHLYPDPLGAPAKAEFFRRLALIPEIEP